MVDGRASKVMGWAWPVDIKQAGGQASGGQWSKPSRHAGMSHARAVA